MDLSVIELLYNNGNLYIPIFYFKCSFSFCFVFCKDFF